MSFYLNEFIVGLLDRCIEASLSAEHGPFHDTLMALCAFAAFDLGRQGTDPDSVSDDEVLAQLADAYRKQMARGTRKEFNLKTELATAHEHFDNAHALLPHLERQAAAFGKEFQAWQAAGAPMPEVTWKQKVFGPIPGSKEDLLDFAKNAFFFGSAVYDEEDDYKTLGRPLEILMDDLPG